jgi:hypothetical protein
MASILKRIQDRNAKSHSQSSTTKYLPADEQTTKYLPADEQKNAASQLLTFEEEAIAVSSINGGEEEVRWFHGLKGGAREEASRTETFLIEQLALTREETSKAQANSLLLQQQLSTLQSELQSIKAMLSASNKNVEESEKVLQRVQDATLEVNRTRSEMILIQQQAAAAAIQAQAYERNAENSARAAQEAVAIQTMKKTRIVHGELERSRKFEEECRKKAEEGRKLLAEEQSVLDKLRQIEKEKRENADVEQGRYSKLKSYADILVLNAQTATVASAEANEKLSFLLANESKAQEALVKYKEHAKEVLLKSKKFEASVNVGKEDAATLQTINEIHAYETETATVLLQTMKLIEKLHEKIEKALERAKEAEAIASKKAKDAQDSQDVLLEYETVLKAALSEAMVSLRDLRDEEARFEKVRSDSVRYDDELERAVTDSRIKSAATIESEDEARKALRDMQSTTATYIASASASAEDSQLQGGSNPTRNVFKKVAEALQNLKKRNESTVSLREKVSQEMLSSERINF